MTYLELVKRVNELATAYYVYDNPILSDKEYDKLFDELIGIEKETGIVSDDSPSRHVGGEPLKKFEQHTHLSKLYSLDKAQQMSEIDEWWDRVLKGLNVDSSNPNDVPVVTLEPKLDGLTLCLTYSGGKFVRATTRGNGSVGEDVTAQVLTIKSLPLTVDIFATIEVQGEGVMRRSKFEAYNSTAQEPLKNPRNGVAGAIRNLDPKVTAKRNLDIYFYNVNYTDGDAFSSQQEMIEFLRKNNFVTPPIQIFDNIKKCKDAIEKVEREKFDYDIDGMVIKVDKVAHREDLGETDRFPRWAVAYKFEALETTTTLIAVEWNVGRTGKITPLAILEPVELCGATISRATLNNMDDIKRKKVGLNDLVFIRRSNDVIPEIMGVAQVGENSVEIVAPILCPGCGSTLIQNGVHVFCPNDDCPPKIIARLEYFCGKDCLDIDGVSSSSVAQMYHQLGVKSPIDLFSLTYDDLARLDGFKEKKIQNALSAIASSRHCTLDKFIIALGISGIGKKTARDLADNFGTLEKFLNATRDELLSIHELGNILVDNIIEYRQMQKDYIFALQKVMEITYRERTGKLVGKTFALTGTLDGMTRQQATALIEAQGGIVGGIGKNVSYVVAGDAAGSKLDKARAWGLTVIDKVGLLELLQ